jgi:hypothetical protein
MLWNTEVHYSIHKSPHTEGSVRFRNLCVRPVTCLSFYGGVVSTSPNPQAGGPPLVGCPKLIIQYVRSYPPYLEAVPPSAI